MNQKYFKWIFLPFMALAVAACGSGGSGSEDNAAGGNNSKRYTLTMNTDNGTVNIQPNSVSFESGTRVTLTATPDDGYDFERWDGAESGEDNPLVIVMDSDKTINARFTVSNRTNYYVDYENGSDTNSGLSATSAWKHAPGDSQATGNAKPAFIGPDITVLLKGGIVYRGSISIPADGSSSHRLIYRGDAWPGLTGVRAIIDGGDPVTGWTQCPSAAACNDNPNYANLYYAYVPGTVDPLSVNLHEFNASSSEDEFLWPAQYPNPSNSYFYDNHIDFQTLSQSNLTRTTLTDSAVFNQTAANYWTDSYVLVWIYPDIVVTRKITAFDPSLNRISFDDLGENAVYADGRNQGYALFNSPHAIDRAGEYFITTTPDNQNRLKILLWPRSAVDLEQRVTRSVRTCGFDINSRNHLTIEGFVVRKHSGTDFTSGVGIGDVTASYMVNNNITVRSNLITHNRKGGSSAGFGGIYLSECTHCVIDGNVIIDNPRQAGIFVENGANITVKNNAVTRSGATALRFYTVDYGILEGNVIRESKGSHSNAITLYLGCNNILAANNRVYDSDSPLAFNGSGNLYFINNIIDAADGPDNVNEWSGASDGASAHGTIAFFNNTFVRNNRNASLNLGDGPGLNYYIVMNNFIDGGGRGTRSNNIYTGLCWNQSDQYGWSLQTGEFVQKNLDLLFVDATHADYRLAATSPARGAGLDITPYFPSQLFPGFDFKKDIVGKTRAVWDIGAYAY